MAQRADITQSEQSSNVQGIHIQASLLWPAHPKAQTLHKTHCSRGTYPRSLTWKSNWRAGISFCFFTTLSPALEQCLVPSRYSVNEWSETNQKIWVPWQERACTGNSVPGSLGAADHRARHDLEIPGDSQKPWDEYQTFERSGTLTDTCLIHTSSYSILVSQQMRKLKIRKVRWLTQRFSAK